MNPEDVHRAALSLPRQERLDLMDRLSESLKPTPEIEASWESEAERRLEGIEAGTRKTLTHEQVFGRAPDFESVRDGD